MNHTMIGAHKLKYMMMAGEQGKAEPNERNNKRQDRNKGRKCESNV